MIMLLKWELYYLALAVLMVQSTFFERLVEIVNFNYTSGFYLVRLIMSSCISHHILC